mgnify:FL=1
MEINILGITMEIPGLMTKDEYNANKQQIENNEKLKFFSQDEDLRIRIKDLTHDSVKAFIGLTIVFFILITLFFLNYRNKTEGSPELSQLIIVFFVFAASTLIMLSFIRRVLSQYLIRHSLFFFPLPLIYLLISIYPLVDQNGTYRTYGLLILTLIVFVYIHGFIKKLPYYLYDEYDKNITIVLAVSSLIFGADLSSNFGLGVIVYLLSITVTQIYMDYKLGESQKEAEEHFENLLLRDPGEVDYTNLVKCYYIGGNKYKEKILNTREFLKIIKNHEQQNN